MARSTGITEVDRHQIGNVLVAVDRVKYDGIVTFDVTLSINGLIKHEEVYVTKAEAMQGACDLLVELMKREEAACTGAA